MISTALTFLIIGLVPQSTESVTLSCGNTSQQTTVQCTCSNPGGQAIEWFVNGIYFTTCVKSLSCSPNQAGFRFSLNSSADLYFLFIDLHSYVRCGEYECRDLSSPSSKDSVEISISDTYLDTTWEPEEQIQPANHTDGNFSVTSPCLFDLNEDTTKIQWYTISNGDKEVYFPKKNSTNYITTSCQACKGVIATQIQTSFLHDESNPGDLIPKEVSFAVEIYNKSISFPGVYYIFRSNSSEPPNETNPVTSPGITATVSLQNTQQPTSKSTNVPPIPGTAFRCWIIIITWIVISRLLYVQTWLPGYSIYRRRNEIKELNNVQSVEITMILLTGLPLIGLISCIWGYFKIEKDPKWLKWPLVGFIVGCIQPGFGLFITGAVYATHVQNCISFVFTAVIFVLMVGLEVALIVTCTVCKIKWYYYISFFGGFILVWIIIAVIMVKCVLKLCKKKEQHPYLRQQWNHMTKSKIDVSGIKKLKNVDCTCDVCGQHVMHTLKGFCLNQNIFLCNSCLSKHKCKGKHLKHNQHDEGGREKCFPCERKPKEGHRNVPAHGYCLDCMLYLCTECLIDHNEHELLWMPHHDAKTFDDICCFKTRTDRNNTIPLGFCKTCKMYICEGCTSLHNRAHNEEPHSIIFHQKKETQTSVKKCSECPNPMECYKLSANKYLCADCYDSDSLWTKNTSLDEYSMTILKESQKCQLHNEVGESPAPYSPTDVFCIVCKLYLCKECFKVHRRFRERWIATHKENLFTCKGCQEKNNVFPVECFCIKSKSFLCAVCFEDSKTTSKHATMKKYVRPETITRLSDKHDCELHKVPFQCEESKHPCTVYCLICKTYMCDDCFKKHLRLKQVWNNRKKEVQSVIQSSFKHNEVSPEPM